MSHDQEESEEIKHYANWEETHAVIAFKFIEFVKDHKKKPSIRDLAKYTGYAINTVHDHLRALKEKELPERFDSFRVLSDRLVLALFQNGINGDTAAAKLFFQLVENWIPGTKLEISGGIDLNNLSTTELLERRKENEKHLSNKLLRFARNEENPDRTGSD